MSQKKALVSVVLGTYNGEKFIREQMDSIVEQTYKPIEIIVSDDNSTDATVQIIEGYAQKYDNIKILKNKENLGFQKNFLKATQYAQGEFVAFADQDDVWYKEKIEVLLSEIGDAMLIHSDSQYMDENGRLLNQYVSSFRIPIEERNFFLFVRSSGIFIAGHAVLVRSAILKGIDLVRTSFGHDGVALLYAMIAGEIKYYPKVLVNYRQHRDNTVGGIGSKVKRIITPEQDVLKRNIFTAQYILSRLPSSETEVATMLKTDIKAMSEPTFGNRLIALKYRMKYASKIYATKKRSYPRKLFRALKDF